MSPHDTPPVLKNCRAHEVCGPAALSFALAMAAQAKGPVMFVDFLRSPDRIHPLGAGGFMDMSRMLVAYGASQTELLWISEEALRSGCTPVVIARITGKINLTEGRRLQLAAEAGKSLGIFILPEGMGSNAAETRWHCIPITSENSGGDAQSDSTLFQWSCIKNKAGTKRSWIIGWNETARHIDCLSQTGDRPLYEAAAG